jgi:D-arabinose 1-dehydrogenase-like Zn-dependent alcohol dehydrogenase
MLRSLLTLSDVMATGHHAAVCANVEAGQTVAVVGDGAVGLSGVLAARRLGGSERSASSRSPGTPTARRSPRSSAPRTSSPSAARRRSRRSRR